MRFKPKVVSPEIIQQLDPLEQVIALKFLKEGRWILGNNLSISSNLE